MSVKLPKISKLRHIFRSKSPSKEREQNLLEEFLRNYISKNPTAESLYKLALVRLLRGDLDSGYKLLGESLEKESSSTVRNLALNTKRKIYDAVRLMKNADGLVGEERYEYAISKYKESLRVFRDFPAIQCKIHRSLIESIQLFDEQDPRILENCTNILSFDKHDIQILRIRAEIYRREDRVVEYLQDLTHMNLLEPSDGKTAVDLEKTRRVGMTCDPTSYYELLRCSPDCTSSEIKKAYKKYRILCQPDHFEEAWFREKAVLKTEALDQAYEVLNDETSRKEYDEQRMKQLRIIRKRENSNSRLDPNVQQDLIATCSTQVIPRKNLNLELANLRRENYILKSKVNNMKANLANSSLQRKKTMEIVGHGKRNVIRLKSKVRELEEKVKLMELECKFMKSNKEGMEEEFAKIEDIYVLENLRTGFEDKLSEITSRIHGINQQIHKRIKELRVKEKQCSICMDRTYDQALLHCGHVGCEKCFSGITHCPFCRSEITGKLTLFGI